LITTPVQLEKPAGCKLVVVETAAQMKQAVMIEAKRSDAVVMAAAVADYRPVKAQSSKLKKQSLNSKLKIELTKTDDILESLGKNKGNKVLIGFSLETENLITNSMKKLKSKNLDLIVANTNDAFDVDSSKVSFIYRDKTMKSMELLSKKDTANRILDFVTSKSQKPFFKKFNADVCRSKSVLSALS
jgi:phosphopantothenoylcysteine decarboxylase/phosphopantothenate--cysteine ligase